VRTKTIPGIYELLDGQVSVRQLRDVQVEDLLRRRPVETETAKVGALLEGARVLVTGGGGSIGSELCRQILHLHPSELLLLGHGENSIFSIERELRRRLDISPALQSTTTVRSVIADIRDRDRLDQIFSGYRPHVVFHAAAHKHVPLMEANVEEAITNNVQGTRHLLQCAEAHGTERFVLISTDKAVNPTSIMGATKRVAEMLVRDAALRTGCAYAAVRFGNVLGSRGSVLEVFRDQIARGGPLTVTHPEVRRYFMTIPEAVHLVLQAAALCDGGEVFLLDMGEPTRIVDLARDLIRLSGMKEGHDIEIVFTGLRPGEKLFEELSMDDETFGSTEHEKIMVCTPNGDHAYATWSEEQHAHLHWEVDQLITEARDGDAVQLVHRLTGLVPDYSDEKREQLLERLERVGEEARMRLRADSA
jgi:FlaA1/EpsC-like NDP-sugar epimerase